MNSERQLAAARGLFEAAAPAVDLPLAVRLWDGTRVSLTTSSEPELEVVVASAGVLGALLRRPRLDTLVDHYAAGRIDLRGGDLLTLIGALRGRRSSRVSLASLPSLRHLLPLVLAFGDASERADAKDPRGEKRRRSQADDKAFVQFHYDLSNEFYALFLDESMQYSCAYFRHFENTLEEAQRDKLDMTCRKLRLEVGERLLDIGCGWGGLVCYAAREYGVDALGVTLSRKQYDYARAKVASLGLDKQIAIELVDYRELRAGDVGRFDKIASVGMIEHVGIANYPEYFARLAALLRDRGLLLNHGITRGAKKTARAFRRRRPEKRLMLRYVFPGHELDHVGHTLEVMEAHGFEVRDVEDWREHYAVTSRHWFERLSANADAAAAIVGSARQRVWLAYLAGVSSAFSDGSLRIYQVLASRHAAKGPSELPATRADLYD